MSNNKSDQLQLEIPDQTTEINEQPIEQPTEPDIKTKKGKTYIKKGTDSRGRPPHPNKTTAYGLPVDPDYYKKYYAEKNAIKVQCQICLLYVAKINLKKHQTSSYHQRFCQIAQNAVTDNTNVLNV